MGGLRPRPRCCSWGPWAVGTALREAPPPVVPGGHLWWPHRPPAPFQTLGPAARLRRVLVLRQGLRGLAERGPRLLPRVRPGAAGACVAVWPLGSRQVRRAWARPVGMGSGVGRHPDLTGEECVRLPGSAWSGTGWPGAVALGCRPVRSAPAWWPWAWPGLLAGAGGASWVEGHPAPRVRVLRAPAGWASGSVLGSAPPHAAFGSVAVAARVSSGPRRAATWGSGTRRRLPRETSTS